MHFSVIFRILGLLLMLFSITMLPPLLVGWIYNDNHLEAFGYSFAITLITGFFIWAPVYRARQDLRIRDGFLVTVLFWTVLGCFGALPFLFHENPEIGVVDAVFESLSGLTTTGATILTQIDTLPKSILFYRQQLQWLGGMGIIVLAVAILPMLGIGGMQLYRAETPGPVKDSKLTPRITETAKALWYLYLGLTTACALAYWVAGMDLFDAISHSFSTIAIGGFSTHDASIGFFDSPLIDAVAVVFMLIAGINFSLHYFAWRHKRLGNYFRDPEVVAYFVILGGVSLIAILVLSVSQTFGLLQSVQYGIFEAVSIATTTGFSTSDFSLWPTFLAYLLFLTSFAGACAGSTGGGMKVIRVLLIYRQGVREITRMLHPNAIIPIKLGRKPVPDRVGEAVWGFFSAYVFIFILLFLALIGTGLDLPTAFSTVASCMNNLGPALGDASLTYADLPNSSKWILSFAMLLGRLEIFTLLVLFTPMFWRR